MQDPKLIVALDFDQRDSALQFTKQLDPKQCRVKVGFELYMQGGRELLAQLHQDGFEVFLDLKFHDIPNTVAQACKSASQLGVWMITVHCLGGPQMLRAAAEAVASQSGPKPKLVGVTVLTSMDEAQLAAIGVSQSIEDSAKQLAQLAKDYGLDGIVCSPHEAQQIKQQHGKDFLCVTPGIRLEKNSSDDQHRIMTPVKAIEEGADYLVIGRPIRLSANPSKTIEKINVDINK